MDKGIGLSRLNSASTPLIGSLDAHYGIYWAFVWLGLGSLLPFNFFIIAEPYFRFKLHDSSSANASISRLEVSYENAVTVSGAVPHLVTTLLVTFLCLPHIHKYRVYTSFLGVILCLSTCLILIFAEVQHWRELFFVLIMILVMIQSVLGAVLQNCFFSLTSVLPSRYIQGFQSGQALGGVFVVLGSIISILFSSNPSTSAAIFSLLAILVLLSNWILYFFLERSRLFQIYSPSVQEINNEHEPFFQASSSFNDSTQIVGPGSLARRERLLRAFKQIKWNFFGVLFTYASTLAIFPAYLAKIQPAYPSIHHPHSIWTDRLYGQTMTFLLFYIGDVGGRMLSSRIRLPSLSSPRLLFSIGLSRFIFIILFGFCHFPNTNGYPYIFRYDLIYAALVLIFAILHGYCNTLNMIYAPKRVHAQLRSTAGALMWLALTTGICLGASISYGVVTIYGDSRPGYHPALQ